MESRRKFIASLIAGSTVSIAGCSSSGGDPTGSSNDGQESDDSANGDDSASEDGSASENQETGGAQFEFVEWNVPSEVEINEGVEIGMVVENTGEEAGNYVGPLYERTPDSEWKKATEVDFGTIQPGDEVEMVFEDVVYSYINRYELRLGDFQQTSVLQTVSAKLDWGTEYTTPAGYVIRIDKPELQDSYQYEDYNGEVSPKEPDSGGQWAFLNTYVKNETGQTNFSPLTSEISLLYGNSQADGDTILVDDPINKEEPFDGGELQPGVERSGWIAYQIPEDVSLDDITIAWSKSTFGGEMAVNWES